MRRIHTLAMTAIALSLLLSTAATARPEPEKIQAKRDAIDVMAVDALERLFEESPGALELYGRSAGYAVFDNFKVALLLSGGAGVGVAVDRESGGRTYMKMGTGGVGLGIGGQSYHLVFLFETEEALARFVEKGWQAGTSANASAGTSGLNSAATFSDGVAVFQMTNKGLMANADIAGTKYWKSRKLN